VVFVWEDIKSMVWRATSPSTAYPTLKVPVYLPSAMSHWSSLYSFSADVNLSL
jgi:hypothetical protein